MMTTEAQAPRRLELPQCLSAIISAARRRAGVAALSDAALADEIRDWQRILSPIPADRLEECELRAVRQRSVKALLQPQELLAAWRELRDEERSKRPPPAPVSIESGEVCHYCEGTGWQTFATIGESGNENTSVRPCACSAAPLEIRTLAPMREPQWHKRKHSVIWERVRTESR
jgi:hypothetical protein